ncbi:MAG: two-component system chemotaxis response regulator CheY [bacterium]|jgi:two-component system chemotaxis response regulator CheY
MNKTILAVDDSISIREMVSFTLTEAGYDVVQAVDGIDALRKLKGKKINMIISDVNMPNLDGIELVRKIREQQAYKFTPIIMLTTESEVSKKKEGKDAGANGWIVKPFKPDQLIAVVKKVLG